MVCNAFKKVSISDRHLKEIVRCYLVLTFMFVSKLHAANSRVYICKLIEKSFLYHYLSLSIANQEPNLIMELVKERFDDKKGCRRREPIIVLPIKFSQLWCYKLGVYCYFREKHCY